MLLDPGKSNVLVPYYGRTWMLVNGILPKLESWHLVLQLLVKFFWKDPVLDEEELQAKYKRSEDCLRILSLRDTS